MQQLEMLDKPDELLCTGCKCVKHVRNFHESTTTKRGYVYRCKQCSSIEASEYYQKNKKARQLYEYNYLKTSKKRQAAKKAQRAVKLGKIIRQPCELCGDINTDGHHDDYAKPLELRWLCRKHHRQWHKLNGEGLNACTVHYWTPPKEAKR